MKSFDELQSEFDAARAVNDATIMRRLADELQALGSAEALALAEFALGRCCLVSGEYQRAIEHWTRSQRMYEVLGDRTGVSRSIGSIGTAYWMMGDFQKTLEQYHQALQMHEELGEKKDAAIVIGNTGNVYFSTGDYAKALEYFRRALSMHEELNDLPGVARLTGSIANVYGSTGDYPQALEQYHKTVQMYEQVGDHAGLALFTCNLASIYDTTGDQEQALEYYQRALAINEALGDRAGVAIVKNNLGIFYANIGDLDRSLEFNQQALELYQALGNRAGTVSTMGDIVRVHLREHRDEEAARILDQQAQMVIDSPLVQAVYHSNRATLAERADDLDAAVAHVQAALKVVTDAGVKFSAAMQHKRLRDLAQHRNDFAAYIEHNNEYNRLNEEVRGKSATQKIAVLDAERKMEAERRERDKERALLYGTLPKAIADRMIRGEDVTGDHFDHAAVMFLDIVGFTSNTSHMPPTDVVKMLENIFRSIDAICEQHNVIKIKTIGDSYMCLAHDGNGELGMGNGSEQRTASPEQRVAAVAPAILQSEFYWPHKDLHEDLHEDLLERLTFRIGIHSGPVTAGVIGTQRLQYDVWGDTVNVASRLESTSEPGRIHVSEAFASCLGLRPRYDSSSPSGEETKDVIPNASEEWHVALRGKTEIKGKGLMTTYWLQATEQVDDDH